MKTETTTGVHTSIGKDLDDLGCAYGARKRDDGESDQSYRQAVIDRIGKPHATLHKCSACHEPKSWNGDDRKCAFENQDFDNWNCGTMNKIRDLISEDGFNTSEHPGIHHQWCDDQHYATIYIDEVDNGGERIGYALWVSWYKRRGRTEEVYVMGGQTPRHPTEVECLAIVDWYAKHPAEKTDAA